MGLGALLRILLGVRRRALVCTVASGLPHWQLESYECTNILESGRSVVDFRGCIRASCLPHVNIGI